MLNSCFWDRFQPNEIFFCEERLCSFIVEPANTWSNIGYFVVAILLLRSRNLSSRIRLLFGLSSLVLAVGSTIGHATGTYWGMFVDVTGMFFVSATILVLGLERGWGLSRRQSNGVWLGIVAASLAVQYFFTKAGLLFFALQIATGISIEWRLRNSIHRLRRKGVLTAVGFLCLAFLIWTLDITKVVCNPSNHIFTGHSAWHLLAALSIWVFAQAYGSETVKKIFPVSET